MVISTNIDGILKVSANSSKKNCSIFDKLFDKSIIRKKTKTKLKLTFHYGPLRKWLIFIYVYSLNVKQLT